MRNVDIFINGNRAYLDSKTAIGTILRHFDFTDPANRKQPYTNTIQLPIRQNEIIFEFADQPGTQSTLPYDRLDVEIFVDGYILLRKGIGYIDSIKDGYYNVAVREQPDVIQTMKDRPLSGLVADTNPISSPICQTLLNATSGGKIDFIYNEQSRLYTVANAANFKLFRKNGNMTYFVHSLFTRMTVVDGVTFAGGLLSDSYFLDLRVIASQIGVHAPIGDAFQVLADIIVNSEKSFFDLFKAVLQLFGAVYTISGTTVTLEKYDDLTLSVVDWNDRLKKKKSKSFRIEGAGQNNYMRFKQGGDADERLNQSVWTCNNKNIEFEQTMIEPDAAVYPFLNLNGLLTGAVSGDKAIYLPDSDFNINTSVGGTTQTIINSISDFVFVVNGIEQVVAGTVVELEYTIQNSGSVGTKNHTTVGGDNRYIATYYNSQNDYGRFEDMLANPVVFEVELDLHVLDLHDYSPFNLVRIADLGGDFYVNKLQYNFEKKGKGSKATLIKYAE